MRKPILLLAASLLLSCAQAPSPGPGHQELPAPGEPGMILSGKVVTMNDAHDVLENARVWIRDGRIEALARAGESLPAAAAQARLVETGGVIYPGLIDIHNHPEYAVFPLMPLTRKYKDRYEWRYYDDDYAKRISAASVVLGRAPYYELGMEVGLWGEYMALAGGTTSLQGAGSGAPGKLLVPVGGRYFGPWAAEECLARNIETTKVVTRPAFSYVDIGRDSSEWKKLKDDGARGTLVVHLAEGASPRMADEFRSMKSEGLIGPDLVVIHGVGLTTAQLKEMGAVGAKLVWSPLSNFLLYGRTADVRAAKESGVALSIAPDWAPSGSKSVLGELKVADLVNRRQLGGLFSDRELVEMVTRNPARALGWQHRLGQVAPGFLADLLVVDSRAADADRNLIVSTEENVRLVIVRGDALYGDSALLQRTRGSTSDTEPVPLFGERRSKSIAATCPATRLPAVSLREVGERLQAGLQFDGAFAAQKVGREQIAKDLALCGLPPPGETATSEDAKQMLACRFGLPMEQTKLNSLAVQDDEEYFRRLLANPNIPAYLRALPEYYRRQ